MRTGGQRRGFRMGINGGLGAHRYPLVGSGDTEASWATASYQIYMNIAGANLATTWTHGRLLRISTVEVSRSLAIMISPMLAFLMGHHAAADLPRSSPS